MSLFSADLLAALHGVNGQELVRPSSVYSAVIPELILIGGALLLLLAQSLTPGRIRHQTSSLFTVLVGCSAIGSAAVVWKDITLHGATSSWAGAIARDKFSMFFAVVIGIAVVLSALVGENWLRRARIEGPEYFVLIMLSAAGGMMMAAANDLIVVFLGLEILSIALYVLAGLYRSRNESREAAMKYFILGAFSSALFLYGIALTYGATGTTNLSGIATFLSHNTLIDNGLLLAGMALLLAGFAFKVAAVPFHFWTPDVYQGSPTPVTGFMAAAAKAAGFAALVRVFGSTFQTLRLDWKPMILAVAVLTLLLGSVVAVVQDNVKRMLAYSSISHAGFVLLGLQAATPNGLGSSLFYLLAYTFMVLGSFAIVSLVDDQRDSRHGIEVYRGLATRHPALALGFSVLLLAQAGIPLTSGFLAKFYVISALVENHSYGTAVFAMLTAAVAAYFYIRLVITMYTPVEDEAGSVGTSAGAVGAVDLAGAGAVGAGAGLATVAVAEAPVSVWLVVVIAVVGTIGLGVVPASAIDVIGFARHAVQSLFPAQ